MRYPAGMLAVVVAFSWSGGRALNAQPAADDNSATSRDATNETTPPTAADKARLKAAEEHVRRFELRDADGQPIKIIDRPLLSFGDPTRAHNTGALFAWGTSGRPKAIMEVWRDGEEPYWNEAVSLTSGERVVLIAPQAGRWQPTEAFTGPAGIPDAPKASTRAAGRLRQLKELARRFSAHEFWDPNNSRYELRLLVQPVHRYEDRAREVIDGALFVIAHDTNPEAMLLIELLGESLDGATWKYTAARSSHAELHIEVDGSKVWSCPRVDGQSLKPTNSYWAFRSPVDVSSRGLPRP